MDLPNFTITLFISLAGIAAGLAMFTPNYRIVRVLFWICALSFGSSAVIWSTTSKDYSLPIQMGISAIIGAIVATGLTWALYEVRRKEESRPSHGEPLVTTARIPSDQQAPRQQKPPLMSKVELRAKLALTDDLLDIFELKMPELTKSAKLLNDGLAVKFANNAQGVRLEVENLQKSFLAIFQNIIQVYQKHSATIERYNMGVGVQYFSDDPTVHQLKHNLALKTGGLLIEFEQLKENPGLIQRTVALRDWQGMIASFEAWAKQQTETQKKYKSSLLSAETYD